MSLKLIDEMTIGVTNISNNVTFYRIEGPLSFSLDICWYLNDQLVTVDRFVRLDSKTVVCIAKTELNHEQNEPIERLLCQACNMTIRFVKKNNAKVKSKLEKLLILKAPSLTHQS
ncbi:MAG: hypothetical protein WCH00_00740 [Candidatus Saccharibacteria bacterium]